MTISALWPRMRVWWERVAHLRKHTPRRLRLLESLSLGERRFVALIELEQSRFLVGGTASSLVLLAALGQKPDIQSQAALFEWSRSWSRRYGTGAPY